MQVVQALVLVTKSSNGPKKNFYNPKRRPIHRVQRSRHAYTAFSRFNKGFILQTEVVRAFEFYYFVAISATTFVKKRR